MAFLEYRGRPLCYRLLGDAGRPLLVLAHPLGMTQAVWDALLPGLLPHFRVLSWDLPGHGGSGAATGPIDPEDLADEALTLARQAGARHFHFVGTSIGGVIGQQLIHRHPNTLLSALLTNTGAVIGTPEAWQTRAADVRSKGLPVMAEGIVPRWFGAAALKDQPALLAGWRTLMARGDANSYAWLCEMLGRCDFRGVFGDHDVAVALLGGRDDVATPPASLETLAAALSAPAPTLLDGVGHVPAVEAPGAMLERILASAR